MSYGSFLLETKGHLSSTQHPSGLPLVVQPIASFLVGFPLRHSPDKRLCDHLTKESPLILPFLKWLPPLSGHFSLAQVSSG